MPFFMDLVLKGITSLLQLDDLLLPYKIDLSIYHKIENKEFVEHIDRVGINFYEKNIDWKEYRFSDFALINPSVKIPKENKSSFVEMKDLTDGKNYSMLRKW